MEKKRIEYIDIIKAICIFWVVVAHSEIICQPWLQWITTFAMPTFFAVTGFTYNVESHAKRGFLTVGFVTQKLRRLMLPAAIWGAGYMIVNSIIRGSFSLKSILYLLYGSYRSLKLANSYGPLWFLPCMFLGVCLVELVFQALYKLFKDERRFNIATAAAAIALSIAAYLLPRFAVGYPWGANIAVMAAAFILIGYLFKQLINSVEKLKDKNTLTWLVIFIASVILTVLAVKLKMQFGMTKTVKMAVAVYGSYPVFMFEAVLGMVMMTAAAVLLSKLKHHGALTYAGRASLVIFLVHVPIENALCNALIDHGYDHWILSIPLAVVTIIISCLISMVIEKYIPEVAGGTRRKKDKK